jgi:hypothetical protein
MKRVINFLAQTTFFALGVVGIAVFFAGFELWAYSVRPDVSWDLELVLAISSVGCIGLGGFIAIFALEESVNFSRN